MGGMVTSFGAYSRYVSPITMPTPRPRAAAVVRNPALQTCEQRPTVRENQILALSSAFLHAYNPTQNTTQKV